MIYKFEFIEMENNKPNKFEIDFESEITVVDQLMRQGFILHCQGNILVVQQRSVQGLLVSELIDEETYELITYRIFNKLKRFITTFELCLPSNSIAKPFSKENFKELSERIRKQKRRSL